MSKSSDLFFFCIAVFALMACEGEIPARLDPSDVFESKSQAFYNLSIIQNDLRVLFTARNKFDETLQAVADFSGTLELAMARNASIRKTFTLSAAQLVYARSYNGGTRVLTIDPGDSVVFGVNWNFISDAGLDLRLVHFGYLSDPACLAIDHPLCLPVGQDRKLANPEIIIIEGQLKIFDKVNVTKAAHYQFLLCYADRWVPPNCCPPVLQNQCK